MERMDKEMWEWAEANAHKLYEMLGPSVPSETKDGGIRRMVAAAMAASEAGELEEAWKWFRSKAEAGELDLVCLNDGASWKVGIAHSVHRNVAEGDSANNALLSAYRASKGK